MVLPLIPIAIGTVGVAAGAALSSWLNGLSSDPWEDSAVFNARMREMHGLGLALNEGLKNCAKFKSNPAQIAAWKGLLDNYGKFYGETGTLSFDPDSSEIAQAKDFASKFYFWTQEHEKLCGGGITPSEPTDPYHKTDPVPSTTDYGKLITWGIVGFGALFALKTLNDLFRDYRR